MSGNRPAEIEVEQEGGVESPEGDWGLSPETLPSEDPAQELEEALTPGPELDDEPVEMPRILYGPKPGAKRLAKPSELAKPVLTPEQRLLLLDTWRRSGLPAGDFAALIGMSKQVLYQWKRRFDEEGPAGLLDRPRGGPQRMKLPELTRRTILMLKENNPEWGCQRISDMLLRGPALPASPSAVSKVLRDAGYVLSEEPTKPHPDKVRSFERARPNQLWQTDLFTFVLKRQNRRVYLVAFMDDHSRFIVSYGLHASQSGVLVLECLRAGITSYGAPQEVLTDNGSQYVTWRGKSAFSKELEKRGIQHVVAAPRRPQTLGKIERFWGTLWRECIETSVFLDLGDAQRRVGWFIDYYNFQRPHQGLDGLVPSDRFFGAAPEVLRTLKERVAANALELARHGTPKKPFYMAGNAGGKAFSVHTEGERVILRREGGEREDIDLQHQAELEAVVPAESQPAAGPVCPQGVVQTEELSPAEPAPGVSALDRLVPPGAEQEGGDA
jgi:transposase InsO family protein